MGKVVTGVRSAQRQLIPDVEDWERHELTFLRGIAYKAKSKPDYRFRDLSRLLDKPLLEHSFKRLNKNAAAGVDKVTYQDYQKDLAANLDDLIGRLKRGGYRARLVKRKHIPKSPGKTRPLGIPVLEDKLVQTAVSALLGAIYEQDFHPFSYGYRPRRGARKAADELTVRMQFGRFSYVVEADIKGFFNHLDHDHLLAMIAQRVDDKRFIRLIGKWLKAGILEEEGDITYPEEGTPQGGSVSAVLANIYLHYVLDDWFQKDVKPRCEGEAIMCRYADDLVCCFQYARDAERFYSVLPKRLGRFNLEVAPEKTQILRFSRFQPGIEHQFSFLSFEFYWSKDKSGKARLFRRTARKKLQSVRRDLKAYVKENRHMKTQQLLIKLTQKLRGHYNYFGVVGNLGDLWQVRSHVVKLLYKWLNRRSGRKSLTWDALNRLLLLKPLPKPECKVVVAQRSEWW